MEDSQFKGRKKNKKGQSRKAKGNTEKISYNFKELIISKDKIKKIRLIAIL